MPWCSAVKCSSKSGDKDATLFSFPNDKEYIKEMKRAKPFTHSRLCSKYFERSQFQRLDHSKRRRKLCFGAIPTLFSHVKPIVQRETRNFRKSDEEGEGPNKMESYCQDHLHSADHPLSIGRYNGIFFGYKI
uniref:THAP-type domain-containing protein n=1 Tax=Lepeophtheirus salmonis TaxID=72036 RepID=A0A0K2VAW5_LEPSM